MGDDELQKLIEDRIQLFHNYNYSSYFYQILQEVADDKYEGEKTKLFPISSYNSRESKINLWSVLSLSIFKNKENSNIPVVVFKFLLKEARNKYSEIVKFCQKEKLEIKEVMKSVYLKIYIF